MATRKEILLGIRAIRQDIIRTSQDNGSVIEKLKNRCWTIRDIPISGQDWSSWDMIDPLFPKERGHSVRIVTDVDNAGWVISLTGKKILGRITDIRNISKTRLELEQITGAKKWIQVQNKYK